MSNPYRDSRGFLQTPYQLELFDSSPDEVVRQLLPHQPMLCEIPAAPQKPLNVEQLSLFADHTYFYEPLNAPGRQLS